MFKLLIVPLLLMLCLQLLAQDNDMPESKSRKPSISLHSGVISYRGDLNDYRTFNPMVDFRFGHTLEIEKRFNESFSASLSGMYGKASFNELLDTSYLNFESSIIDGGLNFKFHFDNDYMFNRTSAFSSYLGVGIHYLMFQPYGDLQDENSRNYYYWENGNIMDKPETAPDTTNAVQLSRDYNYESKLTDSIENYATSVINIPLKLGVTFKLSKSFEADVAATYNIVLTDYLDNVSRENSGNYDAFLYTSVGLRYNFGMLPPRKKSDIGNVDKEIWAMLETGDLDDDGVDNANDICPGTPPNVKVDSKGCAIDTDKDGIPDYRDKESNTPKGAIVDPNGVQITDEEIFEAYSDSAVMARKDVSDATIYGSDGSVLKVVDESSLIVPGTVFLPQKYVPADTNDDGYISPEEINDVIDTFLDGTNSFFKKVSQINDLIDYFFEQ